MVAKTQTVHSFVKGRKRCRECGKTVGNPYNRASFKVVADKSLITGKHVIFVHRERSFGEGAASKTLTFGLVAAV